MKNLVKVLSLVLVCAFALLFTGCAPKDGEKAKEKMEEAGYTVVLANGEESSDVVCTLVCAKGVIGSIIGNTKADGLTATLYANYSAAKTAYEKAKGDDEDSSVKKIGKWVVVGSEDAIKDFK